MTFPRSNLSPANQIQRRISDSGISAANPKPAFSIRTADVMALRKDGSMVKGMRRVPTLPVFEEAFCAFAQGTVFKAKQGYISVEDLQPGDWLVTADGGLEQVVWTGSMVFDPNTQDAPLQLTRIMADSFGVNRPESFLSLGSAARLHQAPPDLRNSSVAARMVTPASRFRDGVSVIDVMPPTAVRLYHIALRQHSAVIANGLEVESYHPGPSPVAHLSQPLRDAFVGLFPHIQHPSDFGPMHFTRAPDETNYLERA